MSQAQLRVGTLPPWVRPTLEACLEEGIYKQVPVSEYPPEKVQQLLAQAVENGLRFHIRGETSIRSLDSCTRPNG
jgi:hypothetical protein